MPKTILASMAVAVALSLVAFQAPAIAASAHNLQAGTHTKNSYDTKRTARMKQMHRMNRGY